MRAYVWRGDLMAYFYVVRSALQNSIVYYVQIRMIYKHIYLYYLKELQSHLAGDSF